MFISSRSSSSHLALLPVFAFALLSLVACAGGDDPGPRAANGSGGETRRFDQYPELLRIEGNGVIVAGTNTSRLTVLADATQFRENAEVSHSETYGVDVVQRDPGLSLGLARVNFGDMPNDDGQLSVSLSALAAPDITTRRSFTITASNPRSSVSRNVFVVPAGTTYLSSVRIARTLIRAGETTEGTVTLSGAAPAGGATVTLQANGPITIPASVAIAAGETTARFAVIGTTVAQQDYVRLIARYDGIEQETGVAVRSPFAYLLQVKIPAQLNPLDRSAPTAPFVVPGKVVLANPADLTTFVALRSNNSFVVVPASVTIPPGASEASFELTVTPLFELGVVRITASQGGVDRVADAIFGQSERAALTDVTVTAILSNGLRDDVRCINVQDDETLEVALKLDRPAPANFRVELYSSSPAALDVDRELTFPEGQTQTSVTFPARAGTDQDVVRRIQLFARALPDGVPVATELWIQPGIIDFPRVGAISLEMDVVRGGATVRGFVELGTPHPLDALPVEISIAGIAFARVTVPASVPGLEFDLPTQPVANTLDTFVSANLNIPCHPDLTSRALRILGGGGLTQLTSSNSQVFGGETIHAVARLSAPVASGGTTVALANIFPIAGIALPASVFIPEGSQEGAFDITTQPVTSFTERRIEASTNEITVSMTILVMPEPTSLSINVNPSLITGGQTVSVTLDAGNRYPIPLTATLTSSDPSIAPIAPALILSPGPPTQSRLTFDLTTAPVAAQTAVDFAVNLRGYTASTRLTVTPAATAATSRLRINRTGAGQGTIVGVNGTAGIDCGSDCEERYPVNTIVEIAATPSAGSTFSGWSNAPDECNAGVAIRGTTVTCYVQITTADRTLNAAFNAALPADNRTLTLSLLGNGHGVVTYLPEVTACSKDSEPTCVRDFPLNTTVVLRASAYSGSTLGDWVGCTSLNQTGTECTVALTASRSISLFIN
jgi:hypothetical protein